MVSHDIVKNILNLKKQVDYFKDTVYIKDRSKCSPSVNADGEFYHRGKVVCSPAN